MKYTKNTANFTIFDSSCDYDYEDYKEMCEMNDWEIHPEGSNGYWDTMARIREFECEDFWDNLRYSGIKGRVMITGHLGLWNGRPEIVPVLADNLYEAVSKCIDGDIMDFKLTYNCGVIEVEAYHHDGCNYFELHLLSKRGEDEASRPKYWYYGEDYEVRNWWFKQFKENDIVF